MGSARFPLLLLLGILFLASVSVSYGIAYWEMQNPSSYEMCIQSCKTEEEPYRHEACHTRCKIYRDPESEKQGSSHEHKGEHSESEKEEHDEHDLPWPQPQPFPQPHEKEREHKHDEEHEHHHREQRTRGKGSQTKDDEKEWKGQHRYQDAEEREREREKEKEGEGWESNLEPEPKSQRENNPFLFNSHRFKTVFKNQHGHIRVLETFDQHSEELENLRDYRVAEILSEPNTLVLPLHSDADFFLVVLSGKALLILVNPDGRETYKLDEGDGIKIPAGTTFYFLNQQENQKLRILKLVVTFRRPGKFEHFFLSEYLRGFSENILEASFNSPYEEIHETLLQHEHEKEGVILKVSREHIRELSRHAKSSSRKTLSSKDNPFNLRSQDPIYSNKFGKFYEITPDKNPQLRDLDIFLSCVEINEGALLLPHYNSKATVILVANEGEAKIEVVGLKQQQQQGLGSEEVQRYSAKLSEGDIFAIPSSHPVTVKASSSDFHLLGIGINAENNQRNFLAGEKDNMMRQIHSEVKDIAFPGSGEEVDELIRNQKESYFVDAQPQQREEDGKSKRGPLSSILGAFY